MRKLRLIAICFFVIITVKGQQTGKTNLLSKGDLDYLKDLTQAVVDSSRILPGQKISKNFGPNNTGGNLIRPGGRDCYPSFWIRDYAMSLECGFISINEQKQMLILTAATQCDQTYITKAGSMVPMGAIADHIRIDDSKPIYFPGTYSYSGQGGKTFGMFPPYCDQYYFVHMADYYVKTSNSAEILNKEINGIKLIDRLEMAYKVSPTQQDGVLIYTTDEFRGIDFGFRDVINMTGDLCFPSLLKYRASLELAELFGMINKSDIKLKYIEIGNRLKKEIPIVFLDKHGMLLSSTGKSNQPDVWSTAMAVNLGILDGDQLDKTCRFLADAYKQGTLAKKGNIRHILTSDDFSESTAWEKSLALKNTYQNGAYWGTATGWVCQAIGKVDVLAAKQLAKEYIDDLREGDYRKGPKFGAPWECYNSNGTQNAVYMATVTCPYIVFKKDQ